MADDLQKTIDTLTTGSAEQRLAAAERLAQFGPEARPAALVLVDACADPEEQVRHWAASALEDLGPPPDADVPGLAAALGSGNADVAYWAATLLGRLRERAAAAVVPLQTALESSPATTVRQRAAWALGKIGRSARPATGALQQAAAADDPRLSRLARQALSLLQ